MLSRIAESLFWIGRYIERSDGTARILDVHLQLLLEDPWIEEDVACRSLLSVMGAEMPPEDSALSRADVLAILAVDRTQPASIAYSLNAARENARRAREVISTELTKMGAIVDEGIAYRTVKETEDNQAAITQMNEEGGD